MQSRARATNEYGGGDHLRITGSSASFSPSPRAFSASTIAMTHKIGRIISQGAWFTYFRPSAISKRALWAVVAGLPSV